jgi:hypothetical protein
MRNIKKTLSAKSYIWFCPLALLFCACAQVPESCGNGAPPLNSATHFCYGGEPVEKCGGSTYNPPTHGCDANGAVREKCANGSVPAPGENCGGEIIPPTYTLSLNANPVNCGTNLTGADTYPEGTTANISVTAVEGCTFTGWTPTAGVTNANSAADRKSVV